MMARMLSQPPFPLPPPVQPRSPPGVGFAARDDGGLVTAHGLATFAWDAGDVGGAPAGGSAAGPAAGRFAGRR